MQRRVQNDNAPEPCFGRGRGHLGVCVSVDGCRLRACQELQQAAGGQPGLTVSLGRSGLLLPPLLLLLLLRISFIAGAIVHRLAQTVWIRVDDFGDVQLA